MRIRTGVRLATLALVCAAFVARGAHAQRPARAGFGVEVLGGIGVLPDGLGSQCGGSSGTAEVETAAAVVYRFKQLGWAAVDTRAAHTILGDGCAAVLGPTETVYPRGYQQNPLYATTARVGVETPADLPLFRVSVGGGALWTSPRVPVGVVDLAWSTRGTGARFVIEAERAFMRLNATEESGTVHITPLPMSMSAGFSTVRLGIEIPLAR